MQKLLWLTMIWPVAPLMAQSGDDSSLLTPSELATLDRENAMWRMTRIEEDADTNIERLRSSGFTEEEVDALKPRLRMIWEAKPVREFGWLPQETIERIEAVDREFVIRWRAVRRFAATGIRAGTKPPEDLGSLNRAWKHAILCVLDLRDIPEYRLMNSSSAQAVHRLAEGLSLSTAERRMLCHWQREFDGTHEVENRFADRLKRAEFKEGQLEHWDRFREILGDPRFAIYLSNADPSFAQMSRTLSEINDRSPAKALDLWFLSQKYEIDRVRASNRREGEQLKSSAAERVAALLGRNDYLAYQQLEGARWLD